MIKNGLWKDFPPLFTEEDILRKYDVGHGNDFG